jgi:NodT family efflux transporter outer membrane factor (OMF) lipoprotein
MRNLAIAGAIAAALFGSPALAQQVDPSPPMGDAVDSPEASHAWWTSLNDPVLAALIRQGLDANLDIVQAHARIRRSQALLAGARAAFGPGGSAGLQGRAAQASETEAPGLDRAQRRVDSVQAGIDFSWEVDLFGRLDKHAAAASQRVRASEAQMRGIRLAISAEIANAYFALVGAREQLELARTVAANRERTLRLVASRAAGGAAAPIDEIRARADLEAALSQLPVQEAAVRLASHRIAVLTARSPARFELPTNQTVEPSSVAIRIPAAESWLAMRPDVQEQEAELRARALDVQAIRAEFYPRLTISGVLGFVAGSVASLGTGGSVSWLSAPSLLAPLFDRPKIEARLAAAKANQKELLAAYHQRLLLATEEVENALARYTLGQQQFHALQRRTHLALEAERLSRVRYEAGAADLLELLDAQRTAQQAQAELAGALTAQRQHLVAVFRGIGAGA